MRRSIASCRGLAVMLVLCALALPVMAQQAAVADPAVRDLAQEQAKRSVLQPGNNADVWREVRSGEPTSGYASLPGRETNVLIQNAGQEWRARRNGFWSIVAGWALVGTVGLLAFFYWWKGTLELEHPETGRKIVRFTQLQRWVHWTVAISWCILAISGLIMLFGKNILLPIVGYTLFSWLAVISKNAHNFIGPLFFVAVLVMIVTFIRGNFYRAGDLTWLVRLGGLIGKGHVPSGRYNAGEKIWFWGGVLFLGFVSSITGLILDFPNFDQTRSTMQTANILHLISAALFMLGGLGHIYLGTIGTAGAYQGMKTGVVDEQWAREHHELWYNDIKSGKVSANPEGESARSVGQTASGSAD